MTTSKKNLATSANNTSTRKDVDIDKYAPLPVSIVSHGFDLTQCKRDGYVAIYEQRKRNESQIVAYEVIRISRRAGGTSVINGVEFTYGAAEVYPRSSAWGARGWTFRTHDEALSKYAALLLGELSVA